jgi:hypothetical protein
VLRVPDGPAARPGRVRAHRMPVLERARPAPESSQPRPRMSSIPNA